MERIIFISFFVVHNHENIQKNPYKIKKSIYNAKKTYVFYAIRMILLEKISNIQKTGGFA